MQKTLTYQPAIGTIIALVVSMLCLPTGWAYAQTLPGTQAQTQPETTIAPDNAIAEPFTQYYWKHDGPRVLGYVQSVPMDVNGYQAQYFEKGRVEDHSFETTDPNWQLMYGRLTVDLMEQFAWFPVNSTSVTYGDLWYYGTRQEVPYGFTGGIMPVEGGTFVPYDAQLLPVPGYIVPDYFWNYINRADLFPGGWMHDIGLPLTNAFSVETVKGDQIRMIVMQAFERTVLTFDPLNPAEWQIERGNIGTDALLAAGQTPLAIQPARPTGPKRIEISLAQQWLYAYEGDYMVFDAPVSTGRDGFETPRGSFTIFSKLPLQTMRGSAGSETWEVPNVPNVMYFLGGGYAIHGTYWHNSFGTGARLSHGCVNLPLDKAAWLYEWAPMGTPVIVY